MISKQELEKMRDEQALTESTRSCGSSCYAHGITHYKAGFTACRSILLPGIEKAREEVFDKCMNVLTDAGCFMGAAVVKAKRPDILANK